jgi:D-glucosaminate-6-phosphate ammonia-lyase
MEELKNAINPKTALIYLVNGDNSWTGAPMSLENIAEVAKAKNVPVLFDAANEILTFPPVHLKRGASVVVYSGGKAICGPQSCGLILGKKDILMAAWQASSPHHGPCRDNKVDRDEMFGMVAAVETWKQMDHDAVMKQWQSYLDLIKNKISGVKSVQTMVHYPSTKSQLSNVSPEMVITWDADVLNITGVEMADELAKNKPRIAVASGGGRGRDSSINGIAVTTIGMQPGEEKIVADRIYEVLTAKRNPISKTLKAPLANLSGSWDVDVQFYNGQGKHKLFIEQDGNWIKGTHQSGFASNTMAGTIEGNEVKLSSSVRLVGDSINYTFIGTLSGDKLSGEIFMGEYRSAKFSAVKDTAPAPKRKIFVPSGAPLSS